MAITRITSNASTFIQPEVGSVVNIVSDPMLDWLRVNQKVYVEGGGVYEVISETGFTYELKLLTAVALSGTTVIAELIYPVNEQGSGETLWGGTNGKEW
ncbi:MAG: hypothetical protein H3C36_02130 [Chitinophagaceae bacterium]|nr:hypothetical protein [Chitinophagaceae bacterium]